MITPEEIEGKNSWNLVCMADDREAQATKLTREAKELRRMADRKQVQENMPEIVAGLLERDKKQQEQITALHKAVSVMLHALGEAQLIRPDFDPLKDWKY